MRPDVRIIKFLGIVLFAICTLPVAIGQACPTEYSILTEGTIENVTLKWESVGEQIVTSTPGCLNVNNKFVLRSCVNGSWSPEAIPECKALKTSQHCSNGQIPAENDCIFVTLPQAFDVGCPRGYLKYYNAERLQKSLSIWSSVRRINGDFVHTAPDGSYGKEIDAPEQLEDCNVFFGGTTIPAECSSTHHQLCIAQPLPIPHRPRKKLDIELSFDRKHHKLYLSVYSPRNLLMKMDSRSKQYDPAIYCFTNAAEHDVKSPIGLKVTLKTDILFVFQLTVTHEHLGEYWCEAFDLHQRIVATRRVLAYKKKRGHEYALHALLHDFCMYPQTCSIIDGKAVGEYLTRIDFVDNIHGLQVVPRVMRILQRNGSDVEVILHLTTLHQNKVIGEYHKLRNLLHQFAGIEVLDFRSAEFCMPYRDRYQNYWNLTRLGSYAMTKEVCLNEYNLPQRRLCMGSFVEGAHWEDARLPCTSTTWKTPSTNMLFNISLGSVIDANDLEEIDTITQNSSALEPLDVYLVADIFAKLDHNLLDTEEVELGTLLGPIENLLETSEDVLMTSQRELNATDMLLDAVEQLFGNDNPLVSDIMTKVDLGQPFLMVRPSFVVLITKPTISNLKGLGVYSSEEYFTNESITLLKYNETIWDLPNFEEVELATYVPMDLVENLASKADDKDVTVIFLVYFNDKLFNPPNEEVSMDRPRSKVVNVKIPGFGVYLEEPLPLYFRNNVTESNDTMMDCAFWLYGEQAPNRTGRWSSLGSDLQSLDNQTSIMCQFSHLTHFALLITSQRMIVNEDDYEEYEDGTKPQWVGPGVGHYPPSVDIHEDILSVITNVGCVLSMVGICGIFVTALVFTRWRGKTGTRILLQLSLTIILEIIIVNIAGVDKLSSRTTWCRIVGIFLHYVVLAKCSWMFVSAMLQYLRFVKVLQAPPERLMLKAMVFAWGVPLVPVTIVSALMPAVYSAGSQHFCYPTGLGLYLGLFMPVVIIVTCNLIVFILIMKNIFSPNIHPRRTMGTPRGSSTNRQNRLQIYLGILLFFMLGLPWVFGILAEVLKGPLTIVCMYLFCLTATLQGCVIFLFYVILDHDTRNLWVRWFRKHFIKSDLK